MTTDVLEVLCSILQIIGFVVLIVFERSLSFSPVIIGIAGFSSIVKLFLPNRWETDKFLCPLTAVAGFGMIILACFL